MCNPPQIISRQDFPRTIDTHGNFNSTNNNIEHVRDVSSYYAPTPLENPFIDTSVDQELDSYESHRSLIDPVMRQRLADLV